MDWQKRLWGCFEMRVLGYACFLALIHLGTYAVGCRCSLGIHDGFDQNIAWLLVVFGKNSNRGEIF